MASPQDQQDKPNGATVSSNEFFESIGHQAENVAATGPSTATDDAPTTSGGGDDEPRVVDEIESLCMNCHENGTTRMLLTRIPFFREVIIMSFSCDHCGFANAEVQAAGELQPLGSHVELRLTEPADFARQVVKADSAAAKFVELDVEIPAGRGKLTNVEGLLAALLEDLELAQDDRKTAQPEVWAKIDDVIKKGRAMLAGDAFPFRVYVDDPAGNSWIAPDPRDGVGKWERREYRRTAKQNEALGLADTEEAAGAVPVGQVDVVGEAEDVQIVPNEVYSFPATCPGCAHACTTHMKMVDIPHFKQVVIMSTVCDACGYRSNDVKTGGAIPALGKKITLAVDAPEDLARDILKSESCALECPELGLSVNPGTLGGRFTTVEGLLTQVRDDLKGQVFEVGGGGGGGGGGGAGRAAATDGAAEEAPAGGGGDSLSSEERDRWTAFFAGVDAAISGDRPFTVVLTDPLASSYVQSLAPDGGVDPKITSVEYERTADEEEDLGLTDMRVEGYEKGEEGKDGKESGEEAKVQS